MTRQLALERAQQISRSEHINMIVVLAPDEYQAASDGYQYCPLSAVNQLFGEIADKSIIAVFDKKGNQYV